MFGLFFTGAKAIIAGFFSSLWTRFFPVKTATDQKLEDVQKQSNVLTLEAKAAANAPTSMEKLIEEQKAGNV